MPTTLEQLQYGFDRDSRRVWRQRATTQGWDNAYVYDSLSQVIGDDRGDLNLAQNAIAGIPATGSRWQYDETGNWHGYQTMANSAATLSQSRTHDKGNRLMEVSEAAAMRTDRAGRMLEAVPGANNDWSSAKQIKWDAWSRIVQVDDGPSGITAAYQYDGLARRITRYTNMDDATMHSYYNDKWRPVEERRNLGTQALASYLRGSRHRDDLVRRDRATTFVSLNETRYILMDYFSPAAITDEDGEVTERYQFSAFGLRTLLNPDFTVRSDSECAMEFSFQGQFEDVETGWINYGYRYYLPALGRWACKDPIEEFGGLNLYAMESNSPANWIDHLGLAPGDGCLICIYASHYTSGPLRGWRLWDRGIKSYFKRNQRDGSPVAGYLGCGANKFNDLQQNSPSGGIPNMPRNNACLTGSRDEKKLREHARKEGFSENDFQAPGDESEDLEKAIEAAMIKADDMCVENCCESVQITIKCGGQQSRRDKVANQRCGTTIDVPC